MCSDCSHNLSSPTRSVCDGDRDHLTGETVRESVFVRLVFAHRCSRHLVQFWETCAASVSLCGERSLPLCAYIIPLFAYLKSDIFSRHFSVILHKTAYCVWYSLLNTICTVLTISFCATFSQKLLQNLLTYCYQYVNRFFESF